MVQPGEAGESNRKEWGWRRDSFFAAPSCFASGELGVIANDAIVPAGGVQRLGTRQERRRDLRS